MLLIRLPQPKLTMVVFVPLAAVVVLTGYCQLWSSSGENVPLSESLQWASVNTATLLASMAPLWISKDRLVAWIKGAHPANLVATVGIVFGAVVCSSILSTLIGDYFWGDGVELAAITRRLVRLSPFLLAAAVAITAVAAAFCWRSQRGAVRSLQQRSGQDWIEFPEAPLLKLRPSDMAVIRTARNYCELQVAGRCVLIRVTAKELESRLAPHGFVRVHRGAIVNLSRVRVVQRGRAGRLRLLLDDGSEIAVSKGHREVFSERLAGTRRIGFQEDRAA